MYQADRHEACSETPWDEELADETIRSCLDQSEQFFKNKLWRQQPQGSAATTMYEGAIGMLWAADYVSSQIGRPLDIDLAGLSKEIVADYAEYEAKEFTEFSVPNFEASYFLGHSGSYNILQRLIPEQYFEFQQELITLAMGNIDNPTLEILWGGPGSIIPVLNNLEANREGDSQELLPVFQEQFDYLRNQLKRADDYDCQFWTQDLYGNLRRLTGAGHGFVGNVYPFLRGQMLLSEGDRRWLLATVTDTLLKTVTEDGDLANWPSSLDGSDRGRPDVLVQWCHGAPGVVLAVNDIPKGYSTELDRLLLKAGETIWRAGPLNKGLGLCHGTDGNGFAFLKLFQRTGDELWLDRAKAFASHAISQNQNRPGVWEGDASLPLYLLACKSAQSAMPLWDFV